MNNGSPHEDKLIQTYLVMTYFIKAHIINSIRLCKTEPPCESHSVELIFAQWFEKVLAICLVCGQSQDRPLAGSLKKMGHLILYSDSWQVSSLFNLQHVHRKLKQTLINCGQHGARICINFLWLYGKSNKLESCQVYLALFYLK